MTASGFRLCCENACTVEHGTTNSLHFIFQYTIAADTLMSTRDRSCCTFLRVPVTSSFQDPGCTKHCLAASPRPSPSGVSYGIWGACCSRGRECVTMTTLGDSDDPVCT